MLGGEQAVDSAVRNLKLRSNHKACHVCDSVILQKLALKYLDATLELSTLSLPAPDRKSMIEMLPCNWTTPHFIVTQEEPAPIRDTQLLLSCPPEAPTSFPKPFLFYSIYSPVSGKFQKKGSKLRV